MKSEDGSRFIDEEGVEFVVREGNLFMVAFSETPLKVTLEILQTKFTKVD